MKIKKEYDSIAKRALKSLIGSPKGLGKQMIRTAKDIGGVAKKAGKRIAGRNLSPMQQRQMESFNKFKNK